MVRQIAVVGVNYWPETTGIAPYTTGMAQHLANSGIQVTVVTAVPHYPAWRIFPEYLDWSGDERIGGVIVKRVTPRMPMPMTASNRAKFEVSFALRIRSVLKSLSPDAVVAIVPNVLSAVVAARFAKGRQIPFGVIFQDLVGRSAEQSGLAGSSVGVAVSRLEQWVARSASMVGVVTEGFRDLFTTAGIPLTNIRLLPNWTHAPEPSGNRSDVRERLGWLADEVVALHAGNMGAKQALETVIDAARIADTSHPHVRIVLMGGGSQRAALEHRASGINNIQFLEPQPAETFADVLAAADVLLVNERASVVDMSLPSKLTSYFSVARPVIASVRSDGTTAAELRRAGGGIIIPPANPLALVDAIAEIGADRERGAKLGAAGRRYATEVLSERAATRRSVEFVSELLEAGCKY